MLQTAFFKKILNKKSLEIDETKLVYILSFVVGFLSAIAAAFLKNTIHYTHVFITEGISVNSSNYLYLAYPLFGMLLTMLFVKYVVKDNISHGVSKILYAISQKNGNIKPHNTWSSIVASTLTIGFGGSVGAEAPITLTGSSIGSVIGRFFKVNNRSLILLVSCGAAGAVSGIFKAPIAGIVFVLEILMLDLTIASIVPLLISSVTAATVAHFLMGNQILFSFNITEAFNIQNTHWYILLGIISGFIALYFSKTTLFLESKFEKIKNQFIRLLTGGLALGALIYIFPPFYGEGYETIMSLLQGNTQYIFANSIFAQFSDNFGIYMLFIASLIILKVVATSATNGAGGVGGIFAPSLFIGGINGLFVAGIFGKLFQTDLPDNIFVFAGMAGMMAGVMHAPLTAIFLIAEITGGYNLLIPLIMTATAAYITVRSFERHSLYHAELAKRGELITHDKDKAALTRMNWKDEIETDLLTVKPDDTLGYLVKVISKSKRNIFPVVDENNILEGIVNLDDVRKIMFNKDLYDSIIVKNIMAVPEIYIDVKENIEVAIESFKKSGVWNLPVLDNGHYIGFISKSRIFAAYRELLVEYSEE